MADERKDLLTFPQRGRVLGGDSTDDRQLSEDRFLPPDVRRKRYVQSGGGPGVGGGGYGPSAGAARLDSASYGQPPWRVPPFNARIIDLPLSRLPVAIAAGISTVITTWDTVPMGYVGVVQKLAYVVTAGLLADGRLVTRINLAPVLPFIGVVGAVGTLEAPQDTQIALAPGDVFDVVVTNIGVGAISVAVRSYGWWWRP